MNLRFSNSTIGDGRLFGNAARIVAPVTLVAALCGGCKQPEKNDNGQPSGSFHTTRHESYSHKSYELTADSFPPSMPLNLRHQAHWLAVEEIGPDSDGGWATGSFDSDRNKIDVTTDDVDRFSIDMTQVPVDWNRIVIIGIDGVNTELKKRNYNVYHFARNASGQWIVTNP
jgi:hypothetical protein